MDATTQHYPLRPSASCLYTVSSRESVFGAHRRFSSSLVATTVAVQRSSPHFSLCPQRLVFCRGLQKKAFSCFRCLLLDNRPSSRKIDSRLVQAWLSGLGTRFFGLWLRLGTRALGRRGGLGALSVFTGRKNAGGSEGEIIIIRGTHVKPLQIFFLVAFGLFEECEDLHGSPPTYLPGLRSYFSVYSGIEGNASCASVPFDCVVSPIH